MPAGGDVRLVQSGLPITARNLTNAKPLDVAMNDANGDQLTGFDPSRPATATLTQVAVSAVSVTILAANAARRSFKVYNDSNNRELFLAYGAAATTTAFSVLVPSKTLYESILDDYTGIIAGIWSAVGTGNAIITQVTT